MTYAAVITAGGRVDGAFARALGTPVKALAPLRGSTFLHRTLEALRELNVDRIAVVGGSEVQRACSGIVEKILDESPSGAENLRRALHAWPGEPLLYLTSDMPFVNAAAIGDVLDRLPGDTLGLPLTEWPDFERRFPGAPPFGITLAGEKVVNGGLFVIPSGAAERLEALAMRFFDARKNMWQMARLTGVPLLVQFLLRRLDVGQLEDRARRLLDVPAQAVRNAPPELAYDVDTLEEYRYALNHA